MSEANIPILMQLANKQADRVILYGSGGVGKSHAIATLLKNIDPNRRIIILMTDPNAIPGLVSGIQALGITPEQGQVIYSLPPKDKKAFGNFKRAVKGYQVQSKTISDSKNKNADTGSNKEHYTYLENIISQLDFYKGFDLVTNEEVSIGCLLDLDADDHLIIDGLSPITQEVWGAVRGDKVDINQLDFMPAQKVVGDLFTCLRKLQCHVLVLAHDTILTDREGTVVETRVDLGVGTKKYSSFMGAMTEVIYATKFGKNYIWITSKDKISTVVRKMPSSASLVPDFSLYNLFGNSGTHVEKK